MTSAARTIWDTRIQAVCGIVAVREGEHVELFLSGNFGQATRNPARIAINPNRLYAIEPMMRRIGRFSINILREDQLAAALRLSAMRRREPRKREILGLPLEEDCGGIPFFADCLETLFCELEETIETGDHRLMIARVAEARRHIAARGERPLLYRTLTGGVQNRFRRLAYRAIVRSGAPDAVRKLIQRRRPALPADLPAATYQTGGQTESEIEQILAYGLLDYGRVLQPPRAPAAPRTALGICVVGTHWGQTHCEFLRRSGLPIRLFVCGQNRERTERLAHRFGAEGVFVGVEAAAGDARVQGLILAVPHHLHRSLVTAVLEAGKHVLVEKPIANSLVDADAMIQDAAGKGRILMVAENMHFRSAIAAACEQISLGRIGEPLNLLVHAGGVMRPQGWLADRDKMGGGVFIDIGVHYVRAMRLLMGEPDLVTASQPMQINTKMSGEDGMDASFSSRYGWHTHMVTTWSATWGHFPDIAVLGDKGTMYLWPRRRHLDYYPVAPGAAWRLLSYVRPYSLQARLMHPRLQRVRVPVGPDVTGYPGEVREFVAAIAEERPPASLAEDARRDLEIVLCTYEAAAEGRAVRIPGPKASRQPL